MKQVYATNLLLFACLVLLNSFAYAQQKTVKSYPEQLEQLLVELMQGTSQPLLIQHFNSILKVMKDQSNGVPWNNQDTLWVKESLDFFQNEGASWDTYLDGPRPLIMSFVSPSDGNTTFYWLILPHNFKADQKYPLYLELHGSGGGKNDNPRNMLFRALRPQLKGVTAQGYRKEGFLSILGAEETNGIRVRPKKTSWSVLTILIKCSNRIPVDNICMVFPWEVLGC